MQSNRNRKDWNKINKFVVFTKKARTWKHYIQFRILLNNFGVDDLITV